MIRPATTDDHAAILAIWNPVIRDTTIIFGTEEKTPESLAALIDDRRAAGREIFVAARDQRILGFATYAQFRSGDGYAQAMEHTVIVAPDAGGNGIGRALMAGIEAHARADGGHTLFAAVSGENGPGIAFHERLGFRTVARIPEAGRKFDRWLDLVLMMKFL